jgi:hypothetical protein
LGQKREPGSSAKPALGLRLFRLHLFEDDDNAEREEHEMRANRNALD